jgi:hypothetical protein
MKQGGEKFDLPSCENTQKDTVFVALEVKIFFQTSDLGCY